MWKGPAREAAQLSVINAQLLILSQNRLHRAERPLKPFFGSGRMVRKSAASDLVQITTFQKNANQSN